jgi:hypothetical protein
MSYKLNKTDGELLVELADGQIDTTTTDITLVGRNYKGFGEFINENFIKMVENFASTAAPGNPLLGQLWYDTSEERLKIYNGETFRSAGGPIVSASQPAMVAGDIWIDNDNNKMYFYDGTDLVLVGPDYDSGQGQTGFEVASVIDISARERVVLKIWVGGTLFGVIAKEEFLVSGDNKIDGYPDYDADVVIPKRQLFEQGFNLVDQTNFWYRGTAANSRALVDAEGNSFSSADFLPTTENGETSGSINIKNAAGLGIGIDDTQYAALKIIGTTTVLETQQSGANISIRTRVGNQFADAVFVDATNAKVGIFNNSPASGLSVGTALDTKDLYVSGDTTIDGDLIVKGDATYFNVTKLTVEDKNIELGLLNDSTEGADADVDGAGIIIRSTDGSKDLTWIDSTNAWTSNQIFNLETADLEYRINNDLVLSRTELGPTVATASGITRLGTLVELDVDYLTLDGNTISTAPGYDLTIDADGGNITVSNAKITDLTDPTDAQDAATKAYVDREVSATDIGFPLDVTGLTTPSTVNPYTDVLGILEAMHPAADHEEGTVARVHCTSYSSVSVTGIDVQAAMNKSYLSVLSDDSSAQSVVQDINFDPVTGTANFTPARSLMTFEIVGGNWDWQNTV